LAINIRGNDRTREVRVNERIRAREVRLIDEKWRDDGSDAPYAGIRNARDRNLDLVEVSPNAIPPVCKADGLWALQYEQAKKENEARKEPENHHA